MSNYGRARRRFRAGAEDDNRPLKDFLARRCPEAPAGFLNKLRRKGFVRAGGAVGTPRTRLRPGEHIALTLPEGAFLVAPNPMVQFKVVYEDKSIVVVDKPAGVVSEPGIGHKLDTLLNGLVARYGEALDRLGSRCDYGMVHRLDRDASGLMVVAREISIQRALVRQFRQRRVAKRYTALVAGAPPQARGAIRLALGRTRLRGRAVPIIGGRGAQRAVTSYRVLRRYADATLIEARPETGRWRQIRLHCAALGCPVAGDREHGDRGANALLQGRSGLQRLFLHAAYLEFTHPKTGRTISFSAPLPEELSTALAALEPGGST